MGLHFLVHIAQDALFINEKRPALRHLLDILHRAVKQAHIAARVGNQWKVEI